MDKTTRVKARVKALALREIMISRDKFFIMGHKIADIDSFGAAIGIYCAARQLGKKAQIVIDGVNTTLRPLKECLPQKTVIRMICLSRASWQSTSWILILP